MSYLSATELKRSKYIGELTEIGDAAVSQIRKEWPSAKGEYKETLAIALAALADNAVLLLQASGLMLKAENPAVRICAAHELQRLKDKQLVGAFKQTFSDSFKRIDGSCVEKKMIYPVRLIASDALVTLGVPLKKVQQMGKTSD